jgi:hypothetical protein
MNIKQTAATIAAITSLAGAPAIALADTTTSSPIVVNHVETQSAGEGRPGFLSLEFKNTSNVTATKVVFVSNGPAYFQRIKDVGTFSPGVTITHGFFNYSDTADQQLTVEEVDFVDGTIWQNNQTLSPRARRQATASNLSTLSFY